MSIPLRIPLGFQRGDLAATVHTPRVLGVLVHLQVGLDVLKLDLEAGARAAVVVDTVQRLMQRQGAPVRAVVMDQPPHSSADGFVGARVEVVDRRADVGGHEVTSRSNEKGVTDRRGNIRK
jgi:hypothetical protein